MRGARVAGALPPRTASEHNVALRTGAGSDLRVVVMDEFHFYADPDRGWAWQVPLLQLPRAQLQGSILLISTAA